jgi:tRNA A37 threonylcarbamoyladenosine synthetase subunit TsaC/SUA5/YrdC
MQQWAEQQLREKQQAEANQKKADRLYELKQKELDQRAMELAKAEEDCRKAIQEATKDYNKALVSILSPGCCGIAFLSDWRWLYRPSLHV